MYWSVLPFRKNSKKTSQVADRWCGRKVNLLRFSRRQKVPTIQERQHQWQQCMLQRWERIVSEGLSYKRQEIYQGQAEVGKMISLQSEKWMTLLHTAWVHTHTHTEPYIRHPSILPSFPSVILKPPTKASGLISSSPHRACKDLDPTQGRWDNIPLVWPPPILSPLSLCLGGFGKHKLNRLTDQRHAYTHWIPSFSPYVCLCVMSCDSLGPWFLFRMERPC